MTRVWPDGLPGVQREPQAAFSRVGDVVRRAIEKPAASTPQRIWSWFGGWRG